MSRESIHEPVFGKLTPCTDNYGNWWAELTPKHKLRLYFDGEEGQALDLSTSHIAFTSLRQNEWELRLALANDLVGWIRRHQANETPQSFARRIVLGGAVMLSDGGAELNYTSNNRLFDGVVLAYLAPDGTYNGAEVPGPLES